MAKPKAPKGPQIIAKAVKQHGGWAQLGRYLSLSPQSLRHWATGVCKPNARARQILEDKIDAPVTSWGDQ